MERNPTDNLGTSGTGASNLGTGSGSSDLGTNDSLASGGSDLGGYGESSGFAGTSSDVNTGLNSGLNSGGSGAATGVADRVDQARSTATNALNNAREMAGERLGQAKEKATQLKATLADKLEAGASSLRQQAQGGGQQFAAAGANGGTASGLMSNDQIQRLAGPAADAMERTADFLRNGDLKETLEEQVRTNPARTLLIALGVGYLLGKAIRR
ncbi:hypothetical protein J421_2071 [Gemmatirosa kalamazoonensis]|uniref:DUF883 domain-containing protein n=1 Tax=Gemmatirosa kalamazoonensis TaxID=861299 RepID=W0RJL6_9BACT|nr:hypothetical protein [Gemmatirosa kalamazoonensis]AHG89608.1 hypothetical protein J421_2071 [Gemmatirosa kalamazoonensis]